MTPSKEMKLILKFEEVMDELLVIFTQDEVKEILRVALKFALERKRKKAEKKIDDGDIIIPLDF